MKISQTASVLGVVLFALPYNVWALAGQAEAILNKNNRVLEEPPKTLRSDKVDLDSRIKSEAGRTQPLSDTGNETITVHPVESYLNSKSTKQRQVEQRYEMRSSHREKRLSEVGFSGERIFGLGFVGAGYYGVFGAELDFNVGQGWALGFGVGTGMAYSTWGLQGRYFFNEGKVSTFFQAGYANWTLGKVPSNFDKLAPNYLVKRFFYGLENDPVHRNVHLFYPGIGVLFQHESGLALSAQIDYLIHIRDFSGGLTAGFGIFYYF